MKIIGTVSGGELLCIATENELANIAGYRSTYETGCPKFRERVGSDVQVSPLWEALTILRERRAVVADLATRMRTEAGRMDKIGAALESPIVETKG